MLKKFIQKWGLLPIRFDKYSFSLAFVILMVGIELFISLSELINPAAQTRQHAFQLFALYPGQAFYGYLTYAFIHGNFLHMLVNMIVFGQTGPMCERRMGHIRFFLFTMFAAIFAGWGGMNLAGFIRHEQVSLVGFSGVVFAYIGAIFQKVIADSDDRWWTILDLFKRNILLAMFIVVPLFMPSLGISGEAHLMGFIFGLLFGSLFSPKEQQAQTPAE